MSVPIATSPGRSGFGPQLSLSYDSGAGNGPFGFGWSLSVPAISRKTDKGLPRYQDAEESDVFVLSGAEDLVPVLVKEGDEWKRQALPNRTLDGHEYRIQRYRPRIEGLFARIERWTDIETGESHWRSISKDNVTTWYGKTAKSRIADPSDPLRIFTWLICQSYDDKGNAIVYEYRPEDSTGIDLSQAHESNRTDSGRSTNRYLKSIKYGNLKPNRGEEWQPTDPSLFTDSDWMFEVVFDYEDGHYAELPLDPSIPEANQHRYVTATAIQTPDWPVRPDPFSSYRAGFEVRSYRRCHRVLMFHRFAELGIQPCLVRSTAFDYDDFDDSKPSSPEDESAHPGSTHVGSVIRSVSQSGYVHFPTQNEPQRYLWRSLPPLEFEYTRPTIDATVREVADTENLPVGADGSTYQWVDLDGEGLSGVLTEQAGSWYYKRNVSALPERGLDGTLTVEARFDPLEPLTSLPSTAFPAGGHHQFLDLAGDGQVDVVEFDGPTPGYYERTDDANWESFIPFASLPNLSWNDPNLRFVDLTGDGHADILVTEDEVFTWYSSLGENGFEPGQRTRLASDEEKGPRLVFADGTQSIYLSDMSGDGLADLVRIRNSGEISYWSNLGYGRFGAKVAMDNSPWFDSPDLFDQKRIRLADIDGSGTTDILYLGSDRIDVYRNQSGNSWADRESLAAFPQVDDLSSVMAVDLLGNGTACLVWNSPLPADVRRPMRYIDLMGGDKPHLLIGSVNNLGAETRVQYAPSTKFYLQDKADGKPWITKLPFPVHVVERVDTYDRISGNRFVTRYAYHHGYFDGVEREFRGFGMVEQRDTEEFAALNEDGHFPVGTNVDESSHVPPVLTKTWFHTGVYFGRDHVSDFFAGLLDANDVGEYYREPGLSDSQARERLLEDTVLPDGLSAAEEEEACRALKGSMLRQEVYGLDGTDKEPHPYTVTEQNFTIRVLQPRKGNPHAVFLSHPRESLGYHYERNPADPRIGHNLTLEVDQAGNVLKSATIGYGRRQPDSTLADIDQATQAQVLITYSGNLFTSEVNSDDDHRTPLPAEASTYELTGYAPSASGGRFQNADFAVQDPDDHRRLLELFDNEIEYEKQPTGGRQRRLIERLRTLYRKDDLTALLDRGRLESRATPGESYKLAFTPGLLEQVFQRNGQALLPDVAGVMGAKGGEGGGYVDLDTDGRWWIPSGRVFHSPATTDAPPQEVAYARQHFFLPFRYRDPFHMDAVSTERFITYDIYNFLVQETRDAMGNRVTAGERNLDPTQPPVRLLQDYRVLQPALVMDPNCNRSEVAFDALGLVVGTAVMGKPSPAPTEGDSLNGFRADLTLKELDEFFETPNRAMSVTLLGHATSRVIYDLTVYWRNAAATAGPPAVAATLARETHASAPEPPNGLRIQMSFSYSDGFGREIQKKVQAEPGPAPERDAQGQIVLGADGHPLMTWGSADPRFVSSGWVVFNNKSAGKPVRQYEPFFTDTHRFEFATRVGVSPVIFYDPIERVIATLHPNCTWEKVVFSPWRREVWDVNDTVLVPDPAIDQFVGRYFSRLPAAEYLPTWHSLRTAVSEAAVFAAQYPDSNVRSNETLAAVKTEVHAATPAVAHADPLGRTILAVNHNRYKYSDTSPNGPQVDEFHRARIILDIEGNRREVTDSRDRLVMRYEYDMLATPVHQASMEAGERWMLNDVFGNPLVAWDSRDHQVGTAYDSLRRPTDSFLSDAVAARIVVGRTIYGERSSDPEHHNLRGKAVRLFDQAGVVTTNEYDFKGNLLRSQRQMARSYKTTLDWSGAVPLNNEVYISRTRHDALNRPVQLIAPHTDQPGSVVKIIQPVYNEANLLKQVHAWLGLTDEPRYLLDSTAADLHAVRSIDYDAKGHRTRIAFGNGVVTTCRYDPLTFRLIRLQTQRSKAAFPADCLEDPSAGSQGCDVQDLYYTYDPADNITHIRDDSQQTIYFANTRVEPSTEYTYDAVYRLIEATGREHLGQAGDCPLPHSYNDAPRVGKSYPAGAEAMGRYLERYFYDHAGNLVSMQHRGADTSRSGWTRTYAYHEPSQLEASQESNRLTSTTIGEITETYSSRRDGYDRHGNMVRLSQLHIMEWDFRDHLQLTQRQAVTTADLDGVQHQGEKTWYVYDAAGQRVRKVTESPAGNVTADRLYLNGVEIYRKSGVNSLVIETLNVMDDKRRVVMVEIRTPRESPWLARQLVRYQFDNHLGSVSLELDDQARILSYEEYTPFGSTSYQAVTSHTETPKRYRYTGNERDEESGLYYNGARYYAPWLARWTSCDPEGIGATLNLFVYVSNRPLVSVDPTGLADEKPGWFSRNFGPESRFAYKLSHADYPGSSFLQSDKKLQVAQAVAEGVAVGATAVVVGVVAAPILIAGAAAEVSTAAGGAALALGASAATAGSVTTAVATGTTVIAQTGLTALGVYQTAKTVKEVVTKRDSESGRRLTDPEIGNRIGGLAVGAVAAGFGGGKALLSRAGRAGKIAPAPKGAVEQRLGHTTSTEGGERLMPGLADSEVDAAMEARNLGPLVEAPAKGVSGSGPKLGTSDDIWFHDNLRVKGVQGAPGGRPVNVRVHSENLRHPGSGHTMQINTHVTNEAVQGASRYMTAEGTWHTLNPSNPALMKSLHLPAGN